MDTHSFLEEARRLIGAEYVLMQDLDAYTRDWRGKYHGKALAVLRPASTAQVQDLVRLCARERVGIVPQGGNTGMCGGAVPDGSGSQVILSLSRLNRVREFDAANNTMTVEGGCILQLLQERAAEAGLLFPLSLGAEGSCQIGGNIATNAGGIQVLRYGNTRDLVLGLEVVLASGEVLDALRGLRKDNTGYDLKQCFIGSEGTLGIVTAATLKLFPAPTATAVAFAGVRSLDHAVALLQHMKRSLGERFTAFEVISGATFELVCRHFPDSPRPLAGAWPWHVLMEAADQGSHEALSDALQAALESALEAGHLEDVAVSASLAQAEALWNMRENITHAQQMDGSNIKHDIALPVSGIPVFVAETLALLQAGFPGSRPFVFGHLGDGNLHFNLAAPQGGDLAAWQEQTDAVNKIVHDAVMRMRGSISAEHGVGQLKRDELVHYKTPVELEAMRSIKQALDPLGIMNPGKLLAAA
jgi:FAD/FMN-containing dehydrogenase